MARKHYSNERRIIMKKLLIGLLTLVSINSFAGDVAGEAKLSYTPGFSAGDLYVYDEVAETLFEQLKVKVIKGDKFDAKHGNRVSCFKFTDSRNVCRVSVHFTNY
jgi:hypothetical protein